MQVKIVFGFEKGGKLVADVLPDIAPKTVNAFLSMLFLLTEKGD